MSASAKVKESTLWHWLKSAERQSRGHDIPVSLRRVENALGRSSPDVLAWVGDVMIEIELKSCARPARVTTPIRVKFQHGQSALLQRLFNKHQTAFLLVQVGSGAAAKRYLFAGNHAAEVEAGVTEDRLEILCSNPDDITAFGALAACIDCRWKGWERSADERRTRTPG